MFATFNCKTTKNDNLRCACFTKWSGSAYFKRNAWPNFLFLSSKSLIQAATYALNVDGIYSDCELLGNIRRQVSLWVPRKSTKISDSSDCNPILWQYCYRYESDAGLCEVFRPVFSLSP